MEASLFCGRSGFLRPFCGSCFRICGGGSFCCCGSKFGFLLSHGFGLGLVLSLLLFLTLLGCLFALVGGRIADGVDSCLLLLLPRIETALSFSFVKSAFLDASLKMLH